MSETKTPPKLCECGCGKPAPIATQTDTKRGVTKGQPVRFIRGHHRRGQQQSLEEKVKRIKTRWGKTDITISPFLPGNVMVRYIAKSRRWYCARPGMPSSSTVPHAKVVYEHYYGKVPPGHQVHHKNGSAEKLEYDEPTNLIAIPRQWNWRWLPALSLGFQVPESAVTQAYIQCVGEGMTGKELFRGVCQKLLALTEPSR